LPVRCSSKSPPGRDCRWLSLMVTPNTVIVVICLMSGNSGWHPEHLCLLLLNITSVDLALLSCSLFTCAYWATWLSSAALSWALLAGITICIISIFIYVVAGDESVQISSNDDVWHWPNCRSPNNARCDVKHRWCRIPRAVPPAREEIDKPVE